MLAPFPLPCPDPLLSFSSSPLASRRPPLDELLQVRLGSDAEDEPPILVRDDGELLPLALGVADALEEGLEVLERRGERDDGVPPPLALEAHHGARQGVLGPRGAGVELGLQRGYGDVAEQGPRVRVHDGQVRVVALEGGEEGERDGVVGVQREGRGGFEILDRGLGLGLGLVSLLF